jgi:AraC family transcriptional regulator
MVLRARVVASISTPHFTVTEAYHAPRLKLPLHSHAAANLCCLLTGSVRERFQTSVVGLTPGSVLYKAGGAKHEDEYGEQGAQSLIVELPDRWAPGVGFAAAGGGSRPFPPAYVLARRMSYELHLQDSATPLVLEGLAMELLGLFLRCRRSTCEEDRSARWVDQAYNLLNEDPTPSLKQIATKLGLTRFRLTRGFQARFGCSPSAYLRKRRIVQAVTRLTSSDRSLANIAADAGFSDQSHFCRVFKRYFGVRPTEYRRVMSRSGVV